MTTNVLIKHDSPNNDRFLKVAVDGVEKEIHPLQSIVVSVHSHSEIVINEYPIAVEAPVAVAVVEEYQAPVDDVAPVGNPELGADGLDGNLPPPPPEPQIDEVDQNIGDVAPVGLPVIELQPVVEEPLDFNDNSAGVSPDVLSGIIAEASTQIDNAHELQQLEANVAADKAELAADIEKLADDQAKLAEAALSAQ